MRTQVLARQAAIDWLHGRAFPSSRLLTGAEPGIEPKWLPVTLPQEETWHALVANAEFFFNDAQNEALAEQLREKRRFYREQACFSTFRMKWNFSICCRWPPQWLACRCKCLRRRRQLRQSEGDASAIAQ